MTRDEWNAAQGGLSVAAERAAQMRDLAARLAWQYGDAAERMKSSAWIADVTAWARLGGRR